MTQKKLTLNDFFSTEKNIDEQLDKFEKSEHFAALKKEVFKNVKLPKGFYMLLIRQVSDVLNIDLNISE